MQTDELFASLGDDRKFMRELYWDIECLLAEENEAAFSELSDCRDPIDRTCGICGRIHDTDSWSGFVPKSCGNEACARIRAFWCISGLTDGLNLKYHTGSQSNRHSYLQARLIKHFNSKRLKDIPYQVRFDFLFSSMLERMAHEKKHTGT